MWKICTYLEEKVLLGLPHSAGAVEKDVYFRQQTWFDQTIGKTGSNGSVWYYTRVNMMKTLKCKVIRVLHGTINASCNGQFSLGADVGCWECSVKGGTPPFVFRTKLSELWLSVALSPEVSPFQTSRRNALNGPVVAINFPCMDFDFWFFNLAIEL